MAAYIPWNQRLLLIFLAAVILSIFKDTSSFISNSLFYTSRATNGRFNYILFFVLASLGAINQTTKECDSNDGGLREDHPERLLISSYGTYRGCVGRYEGSFYGIEAVSSGL
jgi:hypothetical protein